MSDQVGNVTSSPALMTPRGQESGSRPVLDAGLSRASGRVVDPGGEVRSEQRSTEVPRAPAPIEASDLEKVVESINEYLQSSKRSLEFSVDDVSGRTVITVMDGDRENVIRQIPPEAVLALVEQFQEEQGLTGTGLVDKA
ncbi:MULTISPECIES: flagellar protein FlaG [unclassified Thioalkalivibrio]|uniref:flagellar protein FlaG n=1 Tax=unclassified Thioalkalivibrio TaxID=2621013 RepID=UPI0003A30AAE|nr:MULTISPECIES: flagellar protein FlaG [unclassified Thioalkalivibrio]